MAGELVLLAAIGLWHGQSTTAKSEKLFTAVGPRTKPLRIAPRMKPLAAAPRTKPLATTPRTKPLRIANSICLLAWRTTAPCFSHPRHNAHLSPPVRDLVECQYVLIVVHCRRENHHYTSLYTGSMGGRAEACIYAHLRPRRPPRYCTS
jgi:hypothetical protein